MSSGVFITAERRQKGTFQNNRGFCGDFTEGKGQNSESFALSQGGKDKVFRRKGLKSDNFPRIEKILPIIELLAGNYESDYASAKYFEKSPCKEIQNS